MHGRQLPGTGEAGKDEELLRSEQRRNSGSLRYKQSEGMDPQMVSKAESVELAPEYIAVIAVNDGKSLRRLLLSDHWVLGRDAFRKLMQACPNLEQLGVGLENMDLKLLQLLMSFAPKLSASGSS